MWKNAKLIQLIKELEVRNNPGNISTLDINLGALVNNIYEKYFQEKVMRETKTAEDEKVNHLKSMLQVRTNQKVHIEPNIDDVWIFGYGSLVWKADFPYIDRRRGYICGFQRRFYQHSIDHRGTQNKPGRVVTLLPTGKKEDRVYGVAYRISTQQKEDVLQHLDHREKNGYERCALVFNEFPESTGDSWDIIMYIANHKNDSYAGEVWQIPRIAEQIFTSAGPSGPNREYLFHLAHAMRELFPGVNDEHLYELELEVLRRIKQDEAGTLERALKTEINSIFVKAVEDENTNSYVTEAVKRIEALEHFCTNTGWKEQLLTKELLAKSIS